MAEDKCNCNMGTVIVAGAIGAAVGAVVALLLAPKPGPELRAELGEKAKVAGEKVKEVAEKAKEKASEVTAKVREHLEECEAEGAEGPEVSVEELEAAGNEA